MSNLIANWWRSLQLQAALKTGNTRRAEQLLQKIQKSGARLSLAEKLFRDKLQSERSIAEYRREAASLSEQLRLAFEKIAEIDQKREIAQPDEFILPPHQEFIDFILTSFKVIDRNEHKLQCTGIHKPLFDDLEESLAEYLSEELSKISPSLLSAELQYALNDIKGLKSGQDPEYGFKLTPHVYFMKYFLENVYCAYLAWFLIYKESLLPSKINICDVAAGPGTVAYGLALLLESSSVFFKMPQMHVSYYSLEKQAAFQYRGLQFWRRYIETRQTAINAYFRFDTSDIVTWEEKSSNIPKEFFDFIVISHCFFYDAVTRKQANDTYKQICDNNLKPNGYVLLIVQGKKLFKAYDMRQSEDIDRESSVIKEFVLDLSLKLVWYKYLTSTGSRKPFSSAEFAKFAETLPSQPYMTPLMQQHLGIKYEQHYALDDYIILAKK